MRIGLLGSGEMGKRHLAAAKGLASIEMVTRATPGFEHLDRCDYLFALLADTSIDAIDVCLPTPLHVPASLAALAAGKHVLCEKPMALSTTDCARILAAAQENDRVLMVAHVLRFFPAYRHLLGVLRGGALGAARRARFTRVSGVPGWAEWLLDPEQSGGAILDLLVHDFDQVIALFGLPSRVEAACIESPNTVRAELACGEVVVQVEGGWFKDGRAFAMGFDVEFERGRLVYENDALTLHTPDGAAESIALPDEDPYHVQLRYFSQCCAAHAEPIDCPPEAGAAAVALALAVREQAARTTIP